MYKHCAAHDQAKHILLQSTVILGK